jgi:hypothetical protein
MWAHTSANGTTDATSYGFSYANCVTNGKTDATANGITN